MLYPFVDIRDGEVIDVMVEYGKLKVTKRSETLTWFNDKPPQARKLRHTGGVLWIYENNDWYIVHSKLDGWKGVYCIGNDKVFRVYKNTPPLEKTPKELTISSDVDVMNVINLKGKRDIYGPSLENAPELVYIGRNITMGGWKLKRSLFYNPFVVNKRSGLTREEAIQKYDEYLRDKIQNDDKFKDSLKALKGKTLACWCYPNQCHGDILIREMLKLYV